ncbi:cytochrome c oxidase subunit 4 [Spiractinospora alimapuensis]|uniref:cytochrome c oxidase subunit 4 n=1 Tax=Spiractinospora alimapuensis TaxID=2820884 RepID=UPI001F351B5E|nr:cytochrome c oxidase subunit 4 [Spiractinospora alimapuensis]QVQ53241.1 cytochrome c oxidase subunit 4 [Spiractinospora alimapuensis]
MKSQAYIWGGIGAFLILVVGVYIYWILAEPASVGGGGIEWTGTVALVFSVPFSFMVGFWIWQAARRSERHHGLAPEDDKEGEIAENAGEYGFFSPHSWWPLFVAMAVSFAALGIVFGWWMFATGAVAVVLTALGWVFEYYRKEFQH